MRFRILFVFLFVYQILNAQSKKEAKLLVGIVIDQMRYDYLDRYWNDFGEKGFKRIINGGYSCKNANYNYKPTYTGPGHASIFTGTTPSVHGIVGNNWYSKIEDKIVYCVKSEDSDNNSTFSPKRLKVGTIADQIKLFTNFKGKSFGVSLKDRGAILPAGHLADGAYWFDGNPGKWVSSDFYEKKETLWLQQFNKTNFEDIYLKDGWKLTHPKANYSESFADKNNYERAFIDGEETTFPYDLLKIQKKVDFSLLKSVPQGNQMLADFAMQLVENEQLGKDDILDFLSISFSATDYIGHQFGVNSREVQDTYIKLDKTIAELLEFLDQKIGDNGYLLFLTSDHGAAMPRNFLKENEIPTGLIDTKRIKKELEDSLDLKFGERKWLVGFINLNIYFAPSFYSMDLKLQQQLILFSKKWLSEQEGVRQVFIKDERCSNSQISFDKMCDNGLYGHRSGEIIILEEVNYTNYSDKGSTHGSPYSYDTHVPLLFYGQGIPNGQSFEQVSITDIVPTLSFFLEIGLPDAAKGKPIKGLVN